MALPTYQSLASEEELDDQALGSGALPGGSASVSPLSQASISGSSQTAGALPASGALNNITSSVGALQKSGFDAFGNPRGDTWTEGRYNPDDPASSSYIADPNAGQYVFDPVTGKHTLVADTAPNLKTFVTENIGNPQAIALYAKQYGASDRDLSVAMGIPVSQVHDYFRQAGMPLGTMLTGTLQRDIGTEPSIRQLDKGEDVVAERAIGMQGNQVLVQQYDAYGQPTGTRLATPNAPDYAGWIQALGLVLPGALPGVGQAVGSALGATGAAASALGSGAINFALQIAGGANPVDALKSAVISAGTGAIANQVGSMLPTEVASVGKNAITQLITTGKIDPTALATSVGTNFAADALASETGMDKATAGRIITAGMQAMQGNEIGALTSLFRAGTAYDQSRLTPTGGLADYGDLNTQGQQLGANQIALAAKAFIDSKNAGASDDDAFFAATEIDPRIALQGVGGSNLDPYLYREKSGEFLQTQATADPNFVSSMNQLFTNKEPATLTDAIQLFRNTGYSIEQVHDWMVTNGIFDSQKATDILTGMFGSPSDEVITNNQGLVSGAGTDITATTPAAQDTLKTLGGILGLGSEDPDAVYRTLFGGSLGTQGDVAVLGLDQLSNLRDQIEIILDDPELPDDAREEISKMLASVASQEDAARTAASTSVQEDITAAAQLAAAQAASAASDSSASTPGGAEAGVPVISGDLEKGVKTGDEGVSGVSGVTTDEGFSGFSGKSGVSGFSGFSGDSGASGFSGLSGTSGISGFSGISGKSGASGFSGVSGESGGSGFSGFSGESGASGFSGLSGVSGASGFSGVSGESGASGFSGVSGESGASGFSGFSGESGISGFSGFSGESGISGWSGVSGESGASGFSGMSGESGASGFSGFSGESGISGYSGASGISGESGFSGFSGISGESGFSGYSGVSGLSGFSGASGISGISGFSGFSGISGESGYSGASGVSGVSGFSGFSGVSGTSGFSGYSGESGVSGFSGVSGTSGASGFSGFSGISGINGVSGFSGFSGRDGRDGKSVVSAAKSLPAFLLDSELQMLKSSGDTSMKNPLEALIKRVEEMNQIDPSLAAVMSQRLGIQPQQAPTFTYGQESSIDDILGLRQPKVEEPLYAEGGYVEPLRAKPMNLQFMNEGGALGRENFKDGKHVAGEGDGQSDDIPAWLADGEFVFPADVVSALGNGSTKAGTDKLYEMMHQIRARARSTKVKDLPPPAHKSPLDYLKKGK